LLIESTIIGGKKRISAIVGGIFFNRDAAVFLSVFVFLDEVAFEKISRVVRAPPNFLLL